MSWIREAISDSDGLADMAYIAIGWLIAIMIGSIVFLCAMSAISYGRCTQIVDVGKNVRAAVPCTYDPNPLGIAIAACLGAFGSPIGALALYMGQTRRNAAQGKPPPEQPNGALALYMGRTRRAPGKSSTTPSRAGAPPKPKRKR